MGNFKRCIYTFNRGEFYRWCKSVNISTFYAKEIWKALYRDKISNFDELFACVKTEHIFKLKEYFYFPYFKEIMHKRSSDCTIKFLFEIDARNSRTVSTKIPNPYTAELSAKQSGSSKYIIETVLMEHPFGNSICVTTQVGCNIGCSFCASGQVKKLKDLSTAEIVAQVIHISRYLESSSQFLKNHKQSSLCCEFSQQSQSRVTSIKPRISNIVIMGIGEPFDNYNNLIKFLGIVTDDLGLAIGKKHISVSTSGIAPKIIQFAREKININLAISLHAPNDNLREQLMKINKSYPLETLFASIKEYIRLTGNRVAFEYIMIKDFNDSLLQADELVALLKPLEKKAYVNLIPYNPVEGVEYERSSEKNIKAFFERLIQNKIRCVVRKENGSDVDAACGQLRVKYSSKTSD